MASIASGRSARGAIAALFDPLPAAISIARPYGPVAWRIARRFSASSRSSKVRHGSSFSADLASKPYRVMGLIGALPRRFRP
jgi:hypothetical protein